MDLAEMIIDKIRRDEIDQGIAAEEISKFYPMSRATLNRFLNHELIRNARHIVAMARWVGLTSKEAQIRLLQMYDFLSGFDEKAQFALTDTVVFLVDLGMPFPTTGVEEMLSRLESKGEYVIRRQAVDVPLGAGSIMNAEFKPWMISLLGPGRYKMRIFQGDTVLAVGEFELIE